MKSYLVETQDDSAPVKYKVLLKKNVYNKLDKLNRLQLLSINKQAGCNGWA